MKILTKMFLVSCVLITSLLSSEELIVDKSHSEVGFSIKHMMISNVKGNFNEYEADIEYDPKTKNFTFLNATVAATSIDTGIEKRDNHLRSGDFFEVSKFPNITYKMKSYSSSGDTGVMVGDLTIRGVTKEVKLDVTINGTINDNSGNTRVGFTLEGQINRKDFGLTWNKLIEAGGFAVGDKVKMTIELSTMVL